MYDWGMMLTDFDVKESKRIVDALAPRDNVLGYLRERAARSTFDRVSDAIGHPFAFGLYCGVILGAFITVVSAAIWGTIS